MAILVMTAPLPADSFVAALRAAAPDVPVWTSDDPHDPLAVEVILAWRIKPGVVARYPNLRVACAIGAGVEKLLAAGDLPPGLPVTRALDAAQNEQIAQWVVGVTLQFTRELRRYAVQQAQARRRMRRRTRSRASSGSTASFASSKRVRYDRTRCR